MVCRIADFSPEWSERNWNSRRHSIVPDLCGLPPKSAFWRPSRHSRPIYRRGTASRSGSVGIISSSHLSHSQVAVGYNDLGGDVNDGEIVRLISEASGDWGIFQMVNHGIPGEVISRLQKVGREFFKLSKEEKEKIAKTPESGIEGYGTRLQKEIEGKKGWVDHLFHKIWPLPPTESIFRSSIVNSSFSSRDSHFLHVLHHFLIPMEKSNFMMMSLPVLSSHSFT